MGRPRLGRQQLKQVAVVATLDSKAAAARHVAALVASAGARPLLVDTSCLRDPEAGADVSREEVARAAGLGGAADLDRLPRDQRVAAMGRGAGEVLNRLPGLDGVLFLGGNQAAAMAATSRPRLPAGLRAAVATTIPPAARALELERYAVVQLHADLVGPPNAVTAPELRAAVAALGLEPGEVPLPGPGPRGLAGVSTLGNTEPLALRVAARLEELGFTPVVFHSSGPGGERLEQLAAAGELRHVVEVGPHELVGEVLGDDVYRCWRPRLQPRPGLRRLFLPGTLDYYCLRGPDSIPDRLRDRPRVMHNPLNANVATSAEERVALARVAGGRLRDSRSAAVVPMRGWSQSGAQGMPLHDAAAIAAFADELERHVPVRRLDAVINSEAVAGELDGLMREGWTPRSPSTV